MHNSHSSMTGFQLNSTQTMVGAVLVGAGALIGLCGAIVGGHALFSASRRWFRELDVPPGEVVKHKWEQTKAATMAGAHAWHSANGIHAHSRV
jgi:Mn2+/Fe2+ NRAMP family transporter